VATLKFASNSFLSYALSLIIPDCIAIVKTPKENNRIFGCEKIEKSYTSKIADFAA